MTPYTSPTAFHRAGEGRVDHTSGTCSRPSEVDEREGVPVDVGGYRSPRCSRRALPSLFALQLALRLVDRDRDRSTFELVLVVLLASFTIPGFVAAWRSRKPDRERLPLDDGP